MQTNALRTAPAPSPARLASVFAILFTAYQLPEGLGMRVLHSFPVHPRSPSSRSGECARRLADTQKLQN